MRRTVALLREEGLRTVESAGHIKEMVQEVGRLLKKPTAANDDGGQPFEAKLAELKCERSAWLRQYLRFLARKRVAVGMGVLFMALGLFGVALGACSGLVTLVVGGGFCAELAWLAEFRLWQLRGSFEAGKQAGLKEYMREPGSWLGALRMELGYGLSPALRRYRRWLWVKRLGLSVMYAGGFVALASSLRGLPVAPLAIVGSGLGLSLALGIEARLMTLRARMGRHASLFAAVGYEVGAGYEECTP